MDGKQQSTGDSTQASSDELCKHTATDPPQYWKNPANSLQNKGQN